jgi:HEPN domain-containing protein/predicted nucleotidyltransferase
MDRQLILDQIVASLRPYDPEKIILFGSWARGEVDDYSDLDLIVVKETQTRFLDRIAEVYDLIAPHYALDVLVYTPAELQEMLEQGNDFLETALAEGLVLYERGGGVGADSVAPLDTFVVPPARLLREGRPVWRTTTMKRDSMVEGRRWLEQAQNDLAAARHVQAGGFYAWACFLAQQVAEKALKAYLYAQGERRVRGHAIQELIDACLARDQEFTSLADRVDALDRYYIAARYPNGLPGGTPSRVYKAKDAQEALALAEETLAFIARKITPAEQTQSGAKEDSPHAHND